MQCMILMLAFLYANSVATDTCLNDYGNCDKTDEVAMGDCQTLGYSKNEVEKCKHYIRCPFDPNYKKCTQKDIIEQGAIMIVFWSRHTT